MSGGQVDSGGQVVSDEQVVNGGNVSDDRYVREEEIHLEKVSKGDNTIE